MSTTMDGVAYLDCGHDQVPEGISTGVALHLNAETGELESMCFKCSYVQVLDDIKMVGIEINGKTNWSIGGVYMDIDGLSVTTWDGQFLGKVIRTGKAHNWSSGRDGRYNIDVVIKDGADVVNAYGTGAPGEYCSLRRRKADLGKLRGR
jgi:hypothetical protein